MNITSPIDAIARIQRGIQLWIVQKGSWVTKGKLERRAGAWKDRASDWYTTDPRRYRCATLITRKLTMIQALRSEHTSPEESELPNEWCGEYQVVCIDRHTCIDKSEEKSMNRKPCHDHRHTWVYNETSSNVSNPNVNKTNYTSSDFEFMRLMCRGNNPKRKPSFIYHIPHVTIIWVHTTWVALSVAGQECQE